MTQGHTQTKTGKNINRNLLICSSAEIISSAPIFLTKKRIIFQFFWCKWACKAYMTISFQQFSHCHFSRSIKSTEVKTMKNDLLSGFENKLRCWKFITFCSVMKILVDPAWMRNQLCCLQAQSPLVEMNSQHLRKFNLKVNQCDRRLCQNENWQRKRAQLKISILNWRATT